MPRTAVPLELAEALRDEVPAQRTRDRDEGGIGGERAIGGGDRLPARGHVGRVARRLDQLDHIAAARLALGGGSWEREVP